MILGTFKSMFSSGEISMDPKHNWEWREHRPLTKKTQDRTWKITQTKKPQYIYGILLNNKVFITTAIQVSSNVMA